MIKDIMNWFQDEIYRYYHRHFSNNYPLVFREETNFKARAMENELMNIKTEEIFKLADD